MSNAIVLREYGGPEALRLEATEVGAPGPEELRIRHTAIGVNFHDAYVRSGLYRTLQLPGIPGIEAAGVVVEAGKNSLGFVPGDRVVYVNQHYGAYSQERLLPASLALRLPDGVSEEVAASITVKGLTACMLLRRVRRVAAGETVLIHAAAGGVGQLLVRWAKHLGAKVIGTVGSAEKARTARECGADHVILYREENFVDRVQTLTQGKGVDVVYDSVGQDTFLGSIDCLSYFGTVVNFGQSSGAVEPFAVSRLAARSTMVTRPILFHFVRDRSALEALFRETFDALAAQTIRAHTVLRLPLDQAADAHRAMESRALSGAIMLIP
jgi:NADPH2:quinone reductase